MLGVPPMLGGLPDSVAVAATAKMEATAAKNAAGAAAKNASAAKNAAGAAAAW